MANPEHLKILEQGVAYWNEWRDKNPEIDPDLSSADFVGENLGEANFIKANLIEADFIGAISEGQT